jgi:transposase
MTRFVVGDDRSQSTLFPERLDDYLGEDNPVRAIDVFVDELDLAGLGFGGIEPETTGRPAYHPATLLKIYVYGYLNRVQSSRRLERECQRNIELVWLTGRLMPDFKTIADFRKDNGEAIRKVCREFVVLCRRLELFSEASVAIDGSKFKAVNTRDRNFTQAKMQRRLAQIDESIARYLSQLDSADRQGEAVPEAKITRLNEKIATLRQEILRLNALNTQMMQTEDKQISLTDPDARSMATSGRGSGMVGYNVQSAVDTNRIAGGDAFAGPLEASDPVFGLSSLPFVVQSVDSARAVNARARPLYERALAARRLKLLYVTIWPSTGIWSDQPLKNVEDLRALSVRTYDYNSAEVMRTVGATAEYLPFNEAIAKVKEHKLNAILTSGDGGAPWARAPATCRTPTPGPPEFRELEKSISEAGVFVMSVGNMPDERLSRYYESVRQQVEADRSSGHRFLAGPTVRQYADRLRDEMIRRRLQHSPINWPAYPLEASNAD